MTQIIVKLAVVNLTVHETMAQLVAHQEQTAHLLLRVLLHHLVASIFLNMIQTIAELVVDNLTVNKITAQLVAHKVTLKIQNLLILKYMIV